MIFHETWENGLRPVRDGWVLRCRACKEYIGVMGCKKIKYCKKCGTKINWD